MSREYYGLIPKNVELVDTPYRKIVTQLPVPESIPVLKKLRRYEPRCVRAIPPIGVVWNRAEGFQIYDKYGNIWLDWTSGVLVASAGHARKEVKQAIIDQVNSSLLFTYVFPHKVRLKLIEKLIEITPDPFNMVLLLSVGSEATERAIKFARLWGERVGGKKKIGIVSFEGAFHGRSLGSQMIGGIPSLKEWIVNLDPNIYQVPYPGYFRCENKDFSVFEETLLKKGITSDCIAAVITETFQGGGASFMPKEYAQKLAQWCKRENVLLIMDEVQAAFGRTGKMFGFEHYGIIPDLICCGKATTSSLPLSAVIGKSEVMDVSEPVMSTHTGNPVCVAAALANLELIQKEKLVENAAKVGEFLGDELNKIKDKYPDIIGVVLGKGLVYGMHIVKKGGKEPDGELAFRITQKCVEKGLMLFSPVGFGGATIKICPPLNITKEAISDGILALRDAIREIYTG